ncbi:hypothetical protein AVEN_192007-1 [Araneus ventricosus]|uniref:Reverse transcriptase/retrotransposon-derived protein RNase H-like domain-containing protein n=1 Tax=Araneus ventricosus TaxID=182803 RepID=A0A4Y2B8U3_ARAVE|nr:hypothetical protein AVEN_192007-1 [Araneus ventricosus]
MVNPRICDYHRQDRERWGVPESHCMPVTSVYGSVSMNSSRLFQQDNTPVARSFGVSNWKHFPLSDLDCLFTLKVTDASQEVLETVGIFNSYGSRPLKRAEHFMRNDQCRANPEEDLAHATLLHHPIPNAPLSIWVDASDVAVGGALTQYSDNLWQPIAFLSMKLTSSQKKWFTYDRELLPIYPMIK